MNGLLHAVKSRVVQAIVGALLVGSLGATWAALPYLPFGMSNAPLSATTSQGQDAPQDQPDGSADVTPQATPQAIASPSVTARRAPTATRQPSGQSIDLHGSIRSVDTSAQSFTLSVGGTLETITVNSRTTYEGSAQQFSDLREGWKAEVSCTQVAATTYLATHVHAEIDN